MVAIVYWGLVHTSPSGELGVTIPDIPGCFSSGSTWSELFSNVQEAVELHTDNFKDGVPIPHSLDKVRQKVEDEGSGKWYRCIVKVPKSE